MKTPTDLLIILTTAVLTALIATPILSPAISHAEGEEVLVLNGAGNDIALTGYLRIDPASLKGAPLVAAGLELTLELDKESYQAGEKPVVTLVAVNRTDKKCKTKTKVVMSSTEAADALSRAMPMPVAVFEKEIEIEVAAEQTLRLPLKTGYAVTAGSMVGMTVSVGELFQHAGSFAVALPVQSDEVQGRVQVSAK